ncbi:MAG: hypothetical protein NTZ34_03395 [Chloroflexi bacterium]|nr:hypothetical protein [Chloroflexota bacterium]
MSRSKKVFVAGISLILVVIVLMGCLPNKKGGFSCVAAPLLDKIKAQISTLQKKPTPNTTQTQTATVPDQAPPQDFKAEGAKIDKVIGQLCTAFKAKDVEGALNYFETGERDKYRKIFSQSPDVMPEMAADLEKAKINFLAFNSNQYSRISEYLIKSGGSTFSIVFINIDGQWLLKAF